VKTVLVIDDERKATWAFEQFLADAGYRPLVAHTAEEGVALVRRERPDIVICDVKLPGMSGLEALVDIRTVLPEAYVILMTAYGTAQTAITAMQHGAFDYLTKPLDLDALRAVLRRAEHAQSLAADARAKAADTPVSDAEPVPHLVGDSPAMQELYKLVGMLTTNRVTVLIEGESGTGKELIARAIHANSPARGRPFVAVNCGGLAESLLESELFGHEKGAFTDAGRQTTGKIEAAADGTLFLDEVGNTSPAFQVRLLRALQEREFQRVGGIETLPVRARIIAATNVPLEDLVGEGGFRRDLYYRLKVVSLHVPPLRERRRDIPLLVEHFLARVSAELERPVRAMDDQAMRLLLAYEWPGNVRELENAVRRAAVFCRRDVILAEHLPAELRDCGRPPLPVGRGPAGRVGRALEPIAEQAPEGQVYRATLNELDRALLQQALRRSQGNQVHAARWLGISRTTLRRRIEELGLLGDHDTP
jgi:DNA-binding NtrC family response regulator